MKSLSLLASALLATSSVSALSIDYQHFLGAASDRLHSVTSPDNTPEPASYADSVESLLELHKNLIEIESISRNEYTVGRWLASYLRSRGFTVETRPISPSLFGTPRENIFAYLGKNNKTRTLISSHIDTVPPYWPYERRDDEIWGRGSVDAKGSVATQIKAVEALIASGDIGEGDVGLLYVVGEEITGDGMLAVNEWGMEWETVIFGEPTELKLASGHKGITSLKVKAHGKAGHSGYPELGRSANHMLIPALAKLMDVEWPSSEKYGNTTCNIGRIDGGVAQNVIAEDAFALISIRIAADKEKVEQVARDALLSVTPDLELEFGVGGYNPVPLDHDVPGFETIVVNYGTDVPHLNGDHKRYLYGPGSILLAHSDHEHIAIKDLVAAVEGYKKLLLHSLA